MKKRSFRMRRLLALVAGAGALVAVPAVPAAAQQPDARLVVRSVDATQFPDVRVRIQVNGADTRAGDFTLRENGKIVPGAEFLPIGESETLVGAVLVIDVSETMAENEALDRAKDAATAFVEQMQPNQRVAVVSFGTEAEVVVPFSSNREVLEKGIDSLAISGKTSLWDGVQAGVKLYDEHPGLQANVLVLSDGRTDNGSETTSQQAKGAALDADAAVYTVALGRGQLEGQLRGLSAETSGEFLFASDPSALTGLYSRVQTSLQNQYDVVYGSSAKVETLDISVAANGLSGARKVSTGTLAEGQANDPVAVTGGKGVVFLQGTAGKLAGAVLTLFAIALIAYAIGVLVIRERDDLSSMLRPYDEGVEVEDDEQGTSLIGDTKFLKKAVALTTQMAERQGVLPKLEAALERADLPLRAGEALFVYVAIVIVLSLLSAVVTRSPMLALLALALSAIFPPAALKFLEGRRRKKFMSQLPDTLQLLAGSLRAGYSLMQGVEAVSQEVSEPMGRELRRVMAEARLGRPLEESLDEAAARMNSNDFSWAVMAIRIQREVGGNLSELLLTVSDTMVARERLRRDVAALTAEGKISAIVLGILPLGLGAAMAVINPEYIGVLISNRLGNMMLGGSILLAAGGFYWMKKTIQIEV
jgi:tight adherence protein B